jgi:hopanoid biosynthesis associated RND transporter like protein HpnN
LPPSALDRLLLLFIRVAAGAPFWVIAVSLVVAALSLWVTVESLAFKTGRNDLVAKDVPYILNHEKYKAEFDDTEGMIVVVEGDRPEVMRQFTEAVAARLNAHPKAFSHVFHKIDTTYFKSRGLLYLASERIETLGEEIAAREQFLNDVGMSPGLNQLLRSINAEISSGMVSSLITDLLGTGGSVETEQPKDDAADLDLLINLLDQARAHLREGAVYRSPWRALFQQSGGTLREDGYLSSDDDSLMFILLMPGEDKSSFTGYKRSIEMARRLIGETQKEFPGVRVGLTGGDVIASDEMVTTQRDVQKATLIALAGVSLLFIVAFRGVVEPLLAVFSLLVALAWSMGYTTLAVGHLNILSVVFTTILIGLGIDFGIHILERYREERNAGRALGPALEQTVRGTGKGNFSGAITTAIAFGAMTFTDFIGIAELGLIAAGGILLCLLAMILLLPALLVVEERVRGGASRPPARLAANGRVDGWFRHHRVILFVSLVLTLLSSFSLFRVRFDYNLLNLQARGTEAVDYELKIIEKADRSAWSAASIAGSLEEALERHRAMEQLPTVGKVESIASVLPEDREKKMEQIRQLAPILRELYVEPEDTPFSLPPLLKTVRGIRFKLQGREEKAGENDPVLEANRSAARFLEAVQGTDAKLAKQRLAAFSRTLFADYRQLIGDLRDSADPAPIKVEDLPKSLRERYVNASGKYLVVVYPAIDIWDPEARGEFLRQMRSVDPEVAGNVVHMIESSRLMKAGYIHGGWYAMGAILIYVLVMFRRPLTALLILLPVAVGSVWTVGIMDVFDVRFNLANLVILPLILGIGVVNGIHIIHRYREEPDKSASVLARSTGQAVVLSSLTTMIGFGAMMVADHRGIYSLGWVLTLGVFSCLAASVTALPALLKLCALKGWRV